MTKPEITDDTDCPFIVLAVVYPGEPLELVGKRGQEPPKCPQNRISTSGVGIGKE